jgi:hypothetical protein
MTISKFGRVALTVSVGVAIGVYYGDTIRWGDVMLFPGEAS